MSAQIEKNNKVDDRSDKDDFLYLDPNVVTPEQYERDIEEMKKKGKTK